MAPYVCRRDTTIEMIHHIYESSLYICVIIPSTLSGIHTGRLAALCPRGGGVPRILHTSILSPDVCRPIGPHCRCRRRRPLPSSPPPRGPSSITQTTTSPHARSPHNLRRHLWFRSALGVMLPLPSKPKLLRREAPRQRGSHGGGKQQRFLQHPN